MAIGRRRALIITGRALGAYWLAPYCLRHQLDGLAYAADALDLTTQQRFDALVLGNAAAYELRSRPDSGVDSLKALALIAAQYPDVLAGRRSAKDAAKIVRDSIAANAVTSPDTFSKVDALLRDLDKTTADAQRSREALAFIGRTLGAGLIGAGSVGASTGIGAALAMVGVGVDFAAPRLAEELVQPLLPPPDDAIVRGLSSWALTKLYEQAAGSPKIRDFVARTNDDGTFRIDIRRKAPDAVIALPKGPRSVAATFAGASSKKDAGGAEEVTRAELQKSMKAMSDKVDALAAGNRIAAAEASRLAREQRAVRELQYTADEARGAVGLGGFVLSHVGGQSGLANKLGVIANAGISSYLAIATPGIGTLAAAGTLANAASAVMAVLNNQPDPMMETLSVIGEKLDYVITRLDFVTKQQAEILKGIREVYGSVLRNQALLLRVRADLARMASDSAASFIAADRVLFDNERNALAGTLESHSVKELEGTPAYKAVYERGLSACFSFAHTTASNENHAASPTTPLDDDGWRLRIAARGRTDRLIGAVAYAAGRLGARMPAPPGGAAFHPPSPTDWASGTREYLAARALGAGVVYKAERQQLADLWRDGQYLRQLLISATAPDVLGGAVAQLREAAGFKEGRVPAAAELNSADSVAGCVYRGALGHFNRTTPKVVMVPRGTRGGRYLTKDAWTQHFDMWEGTDFQVDYFQRLLDRGVLREERCTSGHWGRSCDYVSKLDTAKDKVVARVTDRTGRVFPAIETFPSNGQTFNPMALQETCREFYMKHVARAAERGPLGDAVKAELKPEAHARFEFWGEVVRLLGAVVAWRAAREESEQDLYLASQSGPLSTAEVGEYVASRVLDSLSDSGDWPMEVVTGLNEGMASLGAKLEARAAALGDVRSVPTVDETLRMLGAYMKSAGIELS